MGSVGSHWRPDIWSWDTFVALVSSERPFDMSNQSRGASDHWTRSCYKFSEKEDSQLK